jgi:hypothetical protein
MGVRITRRYGCLLILCGWGIIPTGLTKTCHAQDGAAPQSEQQAEEIRNVLQVETLSEGSSSRRIRDEAIDDLPLDNLRPANRELAYEIVDDISIFRRLPTVRCEMTPAVYSYFRSNPDMAVGIWHTMGISEMVLEQKSTYAYEMATGDGTHGTINIIHRSANNLLMLCSGDFLNPVTNRTINARALFHLVTRFQRDDTGRTWLTHHADMFVMFPSTTIEAIARMISPVSNRICDQNFEEITLFVRLMDVATVRRPEWIRTLADEVEGVSDESRIALADLAQDGVTVPVASEAGESTVLPDEAAAQSLPMPTLFGEDLFPLAPMTSSATDGPTVN